MPGCRLLDIIGITVISKRYGWLHAVCGSRGSAATSALRRGGPHRVPPQHPAIRKVLSPRARTQSASAGRVIAPRAIQEQGMAGSPCAEGFLTVFLGPVAPLLTPPGFFSEPMPGSGIGPDGANQQQRVDGSRHQSAGGPDRSRRVGRKCGDGAETFDTSRPKQSAKPRQGISEHCLGLRRQIETTGWVEKPGAINPLARRGRRPARHPIVPPARAGGARRTGI